jgi:hypothetical protein
MKDKQQAENKQITPGVGGFGGVNEPDPKEEPKKEDVNADEPE